MAVTITPDDVRVVIKTALPDTVLQLLIDTMESKIGMCVNANYDDSTAEIIKLYSVAYLASQATGVREVESSTSANGASVKFKTSETRDGILANQYGKMLFNIDSAGCWNAMITSTAFIGVAGIDVTSPYPEDFR